MRKRIPIFISEQELTLHWMKAADSKNAYNAYVQLCFVLNLNPQRKDFN